MQDSLKQFLVLCLVCVLSVRAFAGGTPTQQLVVQQTNTRAQGDYVSANSGGGQYIATNKYYSYFIEVPPNTSRLVVEIFDPNIYEANSGDIGELQNNNNWDTITSYTLRNPSGTVVATLTGDSNSANNQQWVQLADITSPANGHWEVRVEVTTGDDVNIYGIRAHDGDSTGGGRELNVYAESYLSVGHSRLTTDTKQHVFYPYIIRGCGLREMNFDFDIGLYSGSQILFTPPSSPTNINVSSISGSATASGTGNNGWAFNLIAFDNLPAGSSSPYDLWTQTVTIVGNNQGICLVTSDAHAASAPTTQPENDSFRLYLPTDGGARPVKPRVTQTFTRISGPSTPTVNLTTTYELTFTIENPTPYAIQFSSPSNIFSSFVPGATSNANVTYQGNITVTQGTVISQPSIGGSGTVSWNPGTVAAGTSATIRYRVALTPTSCPSSPSFPLTGSGNDATRFTFVDETGNTSQARATLQIGGLCPLRLNSCNAAPTAAGVTVSGRVFDDRGRGLAGAMVTMRDSYGNERIAITNAFGFYRFLDVPSGETYTFEISSKRYSFPPVAFFVSEDTVLNFSPEGIIGKY